VEAEQEKMKEERKEENEKANLVPALISVCTLTTPF
jgi:hypothetical protein